MKKYFLLILLALFFAPNFVFGSNNPERIFYMSKLREKEGIESLKKNASKIDILAPQVYVVSADLNVSGGLVQEVKKIVQDNNMKVMPLVANDNFNRIIMHNLLVSKIAQDKVIDFLVSEAKKEKYIGWQFDFEHISYLDRELFSELVEKTSKAFKKNNLILSVAVVVRDTDYEDTDFYKNWSGVFDYKRIAESVDFISVMTYDDIKSKGPPASIPFVKKSLEYLKDKIPPEKLSMGIPLYYWGWTLNPTKKVRSDGTFDRATATLSRFFTITGFDKNLGVPWYVYLFNKTICAVFYENSKSFDLKLDIVKENNFRGFSAWVLGIEDPAIWASL